MIGKITNLKGITVEFNYIDSSSGSSSNMVDAGMLNTRTALLLRFTMSGLSGHSIISEARMSLPVFSGYEDQTQVDGEIKAFAIPASSFDNFPSQIPADLIYHQLVTTAPANSQTRLINIDLTNIARDCKAGGGATFAIAIINVMSIDGFAVATPHHSDVSKEAFCRIDYSDIAGLESYYDYTQQDIGFAGKGYVNNLSGELLVQFGGCSTDSPKMPINFNFSYADRTRSPSKTDNTMYGNFRSCFDYGYSINSDEDRIELYLPSGAISCFDKVLKESFGKYGITVDSSVAFVFLNFADYSYIIRTTFQGGAQLDIIDRQKNDFELMTGSWGVLPIKLTKQDGCYINYNYSLSSCRINGATSSDGKSITIAYDSSNRVSTVTFVEENRRLEFTYASDQFMAVLQKITYSASSIGISTGTIITYDEIGRAIYKLNSGRITEIGDNFLNAGFKYDFTSDGKVSKVTKINWSTQESGQYVSFSYLNYPRYTLITNFDSTFSRHYFDGYGMLVQAISSAGATSSVSYLSAGLDGVARKPSGISDSIPKLRNVLLNHSFEITGEGMSSSSVGWKTDRTADVGIIDGGVFGEKVLKLSKTGPSDAEVYQDICLDGSEASYKLVFLAKSMALTGRGDVIVETYENGDSDFSSSYCCCITSDNAAVNWTEFTISNISVSASIDRIRIRIIGKQTSGCLLFDDFQLYPSGHKSSYNYIANGYFDSETGSQPTGFDVTGMNTSTDMLASFPNSEPFFNDMLGNKAYKIQGAYNKAKSISKQIGISGIAGDKFTFSLWANADKLDSETLTAEITFKYPGFDDETTTLNLKSHTDYWQMGSIGATATKPYSEADVKVTYQGLGVCYIDGLSLTRDDYSEHFQYDDKGSITDAASSSSSGSVSYAGGKAVSSSSADGSSFKYTYDGSGRTTQITDNCGTKASFTYDGEGNKTSSVLSFLDDANNSISMTYGNAYDSKNRVTRCTDELGNTTNYDYDSDGKAYKTTYPSGLATTNAYDKFSNLIQQIHSKGSESSTSQYFYGTDGSLSGITASNGTAFALEYDAFKRLTGVKVGSSYLLRYEYSDKFGIISKDNVTKQTYGDSGDCYGFEYDSNSRLTSFRLNGGPLFQYDYDEFGNVIKVTGNGFKKFMSYDSGGKLVREISNSGDSSYFEYDNLSNVQKTISDISGSTISEDYDYKYETNEYSADAYKNRLDRAFGDDIIDYNTSNQGIHGADCYSCSGLTQLDPIIKRYAVTLNKIKSSLSYDLTTVNSVRKNIIWNVGYLETKAFLGWFRFSGTISQGHKILSFAIGTDEKVFVTASNNSNGTVGFSLYMKSGDTSTLIGTSSKTVQIRSDGSSEYAMIGVKVSLILFDFNPINLGSTSIDLYVNGDGRVNGKTTSFLPFSLNRLYIGDRNASGSSVNDSPFKETIALASIGSGSCFTQQQTLRMIYEIGEKYLVKGTMYYPSAGVSYANSGTYQVMDVITLNGTLTSECGIKPVSLTYADRSFKCDKANIFEYDSETKKHVYGSYSALKGLSDSIGKLVYRLPLLSKSVTISARFKINNSSSGYRTIFAFQRQSEETLSYKVDSGGRLLMCIWGVADPIDLQTAITSDEWHVLIAEMMVSSIRTYVDGVRSTVTPAVSVDLTGRDFSVGCRLSGDGFTPTDHLEGNLEMIAYTPSVVSDDQLRKLMSGKLLNRVYTQLDALGRPAKDVIQTSGNAAENIEQSYSYCSPAPGRTSMSVEKVSKKFGGADGFADLYSYDSMGNITSMSKEEGTYQYQYDYLNRLTQEINPVSGKRMAYEYGPNNNISGVKQYDSAGTLEQTWTYSYDAVWKDRLTGIAKSDGSAEHSIAYSVAFVGNPSQIDGKSLSFQGRRLVSYGNTSYAYDENANLASKTAGSDKTEYHYVHDKLRLLVHGSDRLAFHYSERGLAVGFEYGGSDYFYLRDLTGCITDIVSVGIGGTAVRKVSYRYDAWGNWINKSTASDGTAIGNSLRDLNPNVYKGYVYDSDTGLYCLKSRFYSPELRRFINGDSIAYLSNKELNLFAYCGNNPIKGCDSKGTDGWNDFWGGIGNWFANTFGAAYEVAAKVVTYTDDHFIFGYEEGEIFTGTAGDSSKPITFFAESEQEWWKIWEWKVGVSINIGDFHYSFSTSLIEYNYSLGWKEASVDFVFGFDKIGLSTAIASNGVEVYDQFYIRTIPTAVSVVALVFGWQYIVVAGAAGAAAMINVFA